MARQAEILYVNADYNPPIYPKIYVRGNSSYKFFDLAENFDARFPPALFYMVHEDVYMRTIKRINKYVRKQVRANKKWWYCGMLFSCFTCGFSILPVSFRYRHIIDGILKMLYQENVTTYHALGLHWKLCDDIPDTKMKSLTCALVIEFLPTRQ